MIFKNFINYTIILLSFILLIEYSIAKTGLILLFIFFLFSENVKHNISTVFRDKVTFSFILFYLLFVLGMLWTDDFSSGIYILKRESLLLLSPLLFILLDRKYLRHVIIAIFLSVLLSEIIYLLHYFNIIDLYYKSKTIYHFPFIHRMYFSSILAFFIGYALLQINYKQSTSLYNFLIVLFILISLTTLLLMGGRSGYINLFIILAIILVFKNKKKSFKRIFGTIIILSTIFLALYSFNITFQKRINLTFENIKKLDIGSQVDNLDSKQRTSLSCRIEFWYHALNVSKNNPIIGVGTGDSKLSVKSLLPNNEYEKLRSDCGLHVKYHFNTHNLYINILLLFGMLGIIVLMIMFFIQLSMAYKYKSIPMFILILPTMVTMLTQSALFTSHYFISFYAVMLTVLYLLEKEDIALLNLK